MNKMKSRFKILSIFLIIMVLELSMAGSVYASEVTGTASNITQAPKAKEVDLNGKYHAALGIQTCTVLWINRLGYYDAGINSQYNTDKYSVLYSGSDSSGNYVEYPGTFHDIQIKGNGTYTVSLTGADFSDETAVSQLYAATDIPDNDKIKFSDVIVKVNGNTLTKFDEAYLETEKKYVAGGMVIIAINHWRKPLENINTGNGLTLSNNGGIECLSGTGNDSIEITFTVSGFAYDNTATVSVSPTPAAAAGNDAVDALADTKASDSFTDLVFIFSIAAVVIAIGVITAIFLNKKKKNN